MGRVVQVGKAIQPICTKLNALKFLSSTPEIRNSQFPIKKAFDPVLVQFIEFSGISDPPSFIRLYSIISTLLLFKLLSLNTNLNAPVED
jgi:hypothetical protein